MDGHSTRKLERSATYRFGGVVRHCKTALHTKFKDEMNRQHKIEKPDDLLKKKVSLFEFRLSRVTSLERLNLDFAIDFQIFELHLFDSRVYSKQFLFPLVFLYSYSNLQLFEVSVIRSKFPFPLELRITGAHYRITQRKLACFEIRHELIKTGANAEAATRGVLQKKGVLRYFTEFTGNTCARVSFLIKLQALDLQLYLKRDSGTGVFL